MTGTVQHITYGQLLDQVERFAGALQRLGVGRGDAIVIYMPTVRPLGNDTVLSWPDPGGGDGNAGVRADWSGGPR